MVLYMDLAAKGTQETIAIRPYSVSESYILCHYELMRHFQKFPKTNPVTII